MRKQNHLPLDVFCGKEKALIHLDRTQTLKSATEIAYEEFKKEFPALFEKGLTLDCVRLRRYNPDTGTMGRVRNASLSRSKL